jgi:PAP2 superfamily
MQISQNIKTNPFYFIKNRFIMKKITLKSLSIFLFALTLTVISCRKDEDVTRSNPAELYNAKVANDWFDMLRTLTSKTAGFTPPVASRAFGYAGVALYETVVPGMSRYQSLTGQLTEMPALVAPTDNKEYNWAIAANYAMGYIARNFYPTMPADQLKAVDDLEESTLKNIVGNATQETVDRSKEWGVFVAKSVFDWSKTDGGHEGYTKNFPPTFTPPTGSGKWSSTAPAFQKAMQPFWGSNRTFIPQCAQNTQPEAPIAYSELIGSPFNLAATEVFNIVKNATEEQKLIAKFWSDDPGIGGTPPGHSISVATQVLRKENWNLAKAAETYAKVGIAVSDGFVSCWKCKYEHNYLRPITYIRAKLDAVWLSPLATPPFPEYTSGHSVQANAAAKVLNELFGYNYSFVDVTHEKRTDIDGRPRLFKSFNDMAAEASISRLYGGIHYREAIEKGVGQGLKVGEEVVKLKFKIQ